MYYLFEKCPKSKMDNYLQNVRNLKLVIFLDNGVNSIMCFLCLSRSEKKSGRKYTNI